MGWRDTLRTASFRGIEFKVAAHDADFGRRQFTHEYPQRDEPYTEDLGRRKREFAVDAYVVGDDYTVARDKLITACETAGPGELVHPYLGAMQVVCTGLKVSEASVDGRMCRLGLTFIEAGKAQFPSGTSNAVSAVTGAAGGLSSAAGDGFLSKFTTTGLPSFVVDAASGRLTNLSTLLTNLTQNPLGDAQTVAAFFNSVTGFGADALSLVADPPNLLASVTDALSSLSDVFGIRSEAVYDTVYDAHNTPYAGSTATASRVQEQTNYEAFNALVRQSVLAARAQVAVLKVENADLLAGGTSPNGYATREEAIAARDALADALDAEMENPATTTEVFQALTSLRAEVVRGIPGPTLRLPSVLTVTPRATQPAVVLAYRLYQDATRGDEIAARNRAPHPGFLNGGTALEVLSDG